MKTSIKIVTVFSILLITWGAKATIYSASETVADFGTFDQNSASVTVANPVNVGPQACVPTSVANGLEFLDNTYNVPGLMQAGYGTVNSLATRMGTFNTGTNGGTYYWNYAGIWNPGEVVGLSKYLGPTGQNVPSVSIFGGQYATVSGAGPNPPYVNSFNQIQNANPSPLYLYNALLADDAVEFAIYFGTLAQVQANTFTGAHSLTLTGIYYDTSSQSGTLSFMDPNGGIPFTGLNFDITTNGYMFMTGYNDTEPDNPDAYTSGAILTDLVEAVPEPTTLALLALGVIGLGVRRFRRARLPKNWRGEADGVVADFVPRKRHD